jgi:7,8-dihydro-6-hydroxymethylpterin-pyrophosphokinase
MLGANPDVTIVNSSFLYETQAMYVEEQPAFLNAVIQVC